MSDDYSWYGPYCSVVIRYTHGKLSVDDIMSASDKLNDDIWIDALDAKSRPFFIDCYAEINSQEAPKGWYLEGERIPRQKQYNRSLWNRLFGN